MQTYNHNKGSRGSNFKRFQFSSFFINRRLGHFKQLLNAIIVIKSIFDDKTNEIGKKVNKN